MAGVVTRRGLCSTCDKAAECTLPVDPTRPVLQCESYESLARTDPDGGAARPGRQADPEEDPGALKGLCRNCEKRRDCTLPKPEGGVWDCQEYQ